MGFVEIMRMETSNWDDVRQTQGFTRESAQNQSELRRCRYLVVHREEASFNTRTWEGAMIR